MLQCPSNHFLGDHTSHPTFPIAWTIMKIIENNPLILFTIWTFAIMIEIHTNQCNDFSRDFLMVVHGMFHCASVITDVVINAKSSNVFIFPRSQHPPTTRRYTLYLEVVITTLQYSIIKRLPH